MSNQPSISVIIPTYNYAKFIQEAINSVLDSDFPQDQIEIIVIDDGSTDKTAEVIQTYQDRVKYISQKNSGKAWATKVGIEQAQGKYLFNLDADDLFCPNKIKEVVNIFEGDKDIVHVAHPAIYWNVNDDTKVPESIPSVLLENKIDGKKLLSYFYQRRILFGGGSTFAARTEVLKTLDIPKNVDMFIDEYLVLLTVNGGYSFFVKQPLSVWRIHGNNFSDLTSDRDRESYKIKSQRRMASMEAVLSKLREQSFEPEIIKIYSLKNKVENIAIKEQLGQKSIADILELWIYIFSNLKVFQKDIFRIIKNYTILNRSLPISLLKILKQIKITIAR